MYHSIPTLLCIILLSSIRTTSAGGNTINLGVSLPYFHYSELFPYEETLERTGTDSINGTMKSDEYGWSPRGTYGITLKSPDRPLYVNATWSYGKSDDIYDGATSYTDYGYDAGTGSSILITYVEPYDTVKKNAFSRFSLQLGSALHSTPSICIIPYTGYEFNVWKRYIPGMQETYIWHTVPLGIKLDITNGSKFSFQPSFQYNIMTSGWMQVSIPELAAEARTSGFNLNIDNVKLGNRPGFACSLPVNYEFRRDAVQLTLKPWLETRKFGKSNMGYMRISDNYSSVTIGEFHEPASDNIEYGADVTMSVTFSAVSDFLKNRNSTFQPETEPAPAL